VPVHRLAILGRCGPNRRSAPTFAPPGQTLMPEARRPACICRSNTGVRVAAALRSDAGSRRSCPFTGAERWPGVAHHLLRAGARQGRGTGKSVLRCRSGVGTQQPSARAHACILLASRARWPRWNREAQAAPNLAIVSALIEKTESLPSLDADGRGCRPCRGAEATMPGLRVVVPVPQSSTAADRQVAHAP
jgi:hypothetical protein